MLQGASMEAKDGLALGRIAGDKQTSLYCGPFSMCLVYLKHTLCSASSLCIKENQEYQICSFSCIHSHVYKCIIHEIPQQCLEK